MEGGGGGCAEFRRSVTAFEGRRGGVRLSGFTFLVGLSALVYPAANDQVLHLQTKLPPLDPLSNSAEL